MFRLRRRRLLAIALLAALLVWLASSAYVAWKFTRRASPPYAEPVPQASWATLEEHRLSTSDGQEIGAWLIRGDPQKPCVLLLHGNGGARREMLPVMEWLTRERLTVLAISLRAHGDSTGEVNDFGFSARHDVVASVRWLRQQCPGRPIFVLGRSLGAAAAVFAAGELQDDVAGYFLEQPYKSLTSAAWNRLQNRLPAGLDWLAYAGLRIWAPVFLPVAPGDISPCDRAGDIPKSAPVVIVTGSADRHARPEDVEAVFRQVETHGKLVVFDGAAHESLDRYDPPLYKRSLLDLLEHTVPLPHAGLPR